MEQMAQGQKEVWEQDMWCFSHSRHRARGPCTSLPCHPRASAVEEALGNQHSEMAVHLPLPPSCVESMCKYGNGSHAGSSAWAHKHGLSFTRADRLLGIIAQVYLTVMWRYIDCVSPLSALKRQCFDPIRVDTYTGTDLSPCPHCLYLHHQLQTQSAVSMTTLFHKTFPPPLGQSLQQRKDREGFVPREFFDFTSHPHDLGFYLSPSWPHPHYQLWYNTL